MNIAISDSKREVQPRKRLLQPVEFLGLQLLWHETFNHRPRPLARTANCKNALNLSFFCCKLWQLLALFRVVVSFCLIFLVLVSLCEVCELLRLILSQFRHCPFFQHFSFRAWTKLWHFLRMQSTDSKPTKNRYMVHKQHETTVFKFLLTGFTVH